MQNPLPHSLQKKLSASYQDYCQHPGVHFELYLTNRTMANFEVNSLKMNMFFPSLLFSVWLPYSDHDWMIYRLNIRE